MTIAAIPGPYVSYSESNATGVANSNPESAPSTFLHGVAILDPRARFTYNPGQDFGAINACFAGSDYLVINQVPSTIADNNIAASQTPGAAVRTITLVAASGAGITISTSIMNGSTGATVTGLWAIDTKTARVSYGQSATLQAWDPGTMIGRNVRITSGGNDSGITFTVAGYDIYGFPMTETITGANAGIAAGLKAWKFISGITCSGDVATTVKVGTGDVYGFPLRTDLFALAMINWNATAITANTGFVVPDATSPATATTGDVRGTYATQSASDGTKRLVISVMVTPTNIVSTTGLFGVTQF